jgi:signal transduction histidine kinase/CheY-like chemotaxis protein
MSVSHHNHSFPKAQQGVMDLTEWDFEKDGSIPLDGEWEFYWNRLLTTFDERGLSGKEEPKYYPVPSQWKPSSLVDSSKGAATYRLTLKLNPSTQSYGIRISYIRLSSKVLINGVEVGGSGMPGLDWSSYTPENKPYAVFFPIIGDQAEIVIQAANYDSSFGGIVDSIYFGDAQAISARNTSIFGYELAVIVAILLIGLYHLSTFVWRRQEKGFLWFGLYCIGAATAYASYGSKLFMYFVPWLSFELSQKVQTMSQYAAIIFLALFIQAVCRELIPRWAIRVVLITSVTYLLIIAVLPFRVFNVFTVLFGIIQFAEYAGMTFLLYFSYIRGQYGSFGRRNVWILIMAIFVLMISFFDFSVFLMGWSSQYLLGTVGMLMFSILVALMLAHRFSEAFATIEQVTDRLRSADKLKDEFLVRTSHEFQTPLNGLINMTQFMLEERGGIVTDVNRNNLSMMLSISRRLSSLVRDILDLEAIKRDEIHLRPAALDIKAAVEVTLETFAYMVEGKRFRIISRIEEGLPLAAADENRFRQILFNLLGNSVKFTLEGLIVIEVVQLDSQMIKLTVEDSGIGIPSERWESIFNRYDQGESHIADEYGGTGLGLSISRRLAELMGGKLDVEWSEPNKGTRFRLTLPIAETGLDYVSSNDDYSGSKAAAEHASVNGPSEGWTARTMAAAGVQVADPYAPSSSEPVTLLAVDDQTSNLQVLTNLFSSPSCRILTATDGQEALQLLKLHPEISLVLLDVTMPRMSGYEVCRQIRKQYPLIELPVIMLTARSGPEELVAGFAAGANDFVTKPFYAEEVRSRVGTLLQMRQSVRLALASEIAFLQSQIKPHFLYNALNAIISFCYVDGVKAAKLLAHLSNYLRKSFDITGTERFVSLAGELELVDAYVQIEQSRFDERLIVEYEIDESLMNLRLPPLTIQPLMENAIRHGVLKREEGGRIILSVKSSEEGFTVRVQDNGLGISPAKLAGLFKREPEQRAEKERTGVGLSNIDRRLRSVYGRGLHVESTVGRGTEVSFHIVNKGAVN